MLEEIQAWDRRGAFAEGGRLEDHGLGAQPEDVLAVGGVPWRPQGSSYRMSKTDVDGNGPGRRILEAIQDRYVRGMPLIADRDRSLSEAAIRVFGSWRTRAGGRGSQT